MLQTGFTPKLLSEIIYLRWAKTTSRVPSLNQPLGHWKTRDHYFGRRIEYHVAHEDICCHFDIRRRRRVANHSFRGESICCPVFATWEKTDSRHYEEHVRKSLSKGSWSNVWSMSDNSTSKMGWSSPVWERSWWGIEAGLRWQTAFKFS